MLLHVVQDHVKVPDKTRPRRRIQLLHDLTAEDEKGVVNILNLSTTLGRQPHAHHPTVTIVAFTRYAAGVNQLVGQVSGGPDGYPKKLGELSHLHGTPVLKHT